MTLSQIILLNELKKVTNNNIFLFIFLNKVKSELFDSFTNLINLTDTRIFEIIDIDMITKEINMVEEFFLGFLE